MTDAPTLVSLFDGIGGFPLGFSRAGFRTVATVEIDKAAAGVTAMHFPEAQHFPDVTEVTGAELLAAGFDPRRGVVTGGWPCTDLSLAGLRLGLGGARSGLVGEVFRLLGELRPRWFVLENVPGLLSSVCPCPGGGVCGGGQRTVRDGDAETLEAVPCADSHPVRGGACGRRVRRGRAIGVGRCMALHGGGLGTVLRSLGELGYGVAYRVLDAQHFGVPQRRRRVVIVGCLGDWAAPVSVLFEPGRSGGDHPASGTPGTGATGRAGVGARGTSPAVVNALTANMSGGGGGADDNTAQGGHLIAQTLTAREGKGPGSDVTNGNIITHALTAEGADASEDGTGRGTPLVAMAFDETMITAPHGGQELDPDGPSPAITAGGRPTVAMAFDLAPHGDGPISPDRPVPTLNTTAAMSVATGGDPDPLVVAVNTTLGLSVGRDEVVPTLAVGNGHNTAGGIVAGDAARVMPTLTASTALGNSSQDEQVIPVAFHENQRHEVTVSSTMGPLTTGGGKPGQGYPAIAFRHKNGMDPQASEDVTPTLRNGSAGAAAATGGEPAYALRANPGGVGQGHNTNYVPDLTAVRRLTPVECERLQGYPDGWTAVSAGREQKDSPRYKQLGNSIAVPVFEWVARRIAAYDAEHYREDQA